MTDNGLIFLIHKNLLQISRNNGQYKKKMSKVMTGQFTEGKKNDLKYLKSIKRLLNLTHSKRKTNLHYNDIPIWWEIYNALWEKGISYIASRMDRSLQEAIRQ